MSLPVCPECGGELILHHLAGPKNGDCEHCGQKPWNFGEAPCIECPACGGSGVDITELVEALGSQFELWLGYHAGRGNIETRKGFAFPDFRLWVLAVLDKEGT